MAATKEQIVSDIELRLTQGKPSADFGVPKAQIERWVDIARDKYVTEYVIESMKVGGIHGIDPADISQANGAISAVAGVGHRFTSTSDILDIPPQDSGLLKVSLVETATNTYTRIEKTDIFTNDIIEDMEFSAATLAKPTCYRVATDIYIKGLGSITVGDYLLQIEYIQSMTGGVASYLVADNHVYDITLLAEEIGRREIGLPVISDEVNDGSQNSQLKK